MSRKRSFANLRSQAPAVAVAVAVVAKDTRPAAVRPNSREGRKQIAGFFTPEMSLAMHMLALRRGRSLQGLMAEAFDDVLRKHGESPIGE